MDTKLTMTNTKSQLLNAYNELLNKLKFQKTPDTKKEKEIKEKENIVKSAVSTSIDEIVNNIAGLKLLINKSLDQNEKTLVEQFNKLLNIQEAIKSEQEKLEELYDIIANADTLAALLLAQKEKKQQFETEMAEVKAKFDNEMKETKEKWEKEKNEFIALNKEKETLVKKERTREEEEYTYNLKLNRKKDQDQYKLQKETLEKELKEKKAAFEKEITEREKVVKEREIYLDELTKKVESYPKELEKAIKETEKNVAEKLQTQFGFEKEMMAKDLDGERKLKDQIIKSLQEKIKEQNILVAQLTSKTDNAGEQVKQIALKAIESSSKSHYIQIEKEKRDEG